LLSIAPNIKTLCVHGASALNFPTEKTKAEQMVSVRLLKCLDMKL